MSQKYFQVQSRGGRIVSGSPDPRLGPYVPFKPSDQLRLTGSPSFWKIQAGVIVESDPKERLELLNTLKVPGPLKHRSFALMKTAYFFAGALSASLLILFL